MKKFFLISLLFTVNFCMAGTGSAYDVQFVFIALVGIFLIMLLPIVLFSYFKKWKHKRREHNTEAEETHN